MSTGVVIAVGAAIGLVVGIVVSITTELPLAPEIGLAAGALIAWLWRRRGSPPSGPDPTPSGRSGP
jgi:hypothetical protein